MPVGQVGNPYGAFGEVPGAPAFGFAGPVTIEAQNRSTQDITAGMAVRVTLATSSFYGLGVYTIAPTTGPNNCVVLGVAAETIPATQAVTATTGSVVNQQPTFYQGTVITHGIAYAAFPPGLPPGTNVTLPVFASVATTSVAGIVGASSIAGICTATTTAYGGIGGTTAGISIGSSSSPAVVGICYTSVGLTAAGSTTLFPIVVGKVL